MTETTKKKKTAKKAVPQADMNQELATLFKARGDIYTEVTNGMLEIVAPTALAALREIFGVSEDNLSWTDLDQRPGFLLISVIVTIHEDQINTAFTKLLAGTYDEEIEQFPIKRFLKLGIPSEMVFNAKHEIVEYMSGIVHTILNDDGLDVDEDVEDEDEDLDEELAEVLEYIDSLREEPRSVTLQQSVEFDPKTLSKEQKQSLLYFQHQSRGKLH